MKKSKLAVLQMSDTPQIESSAVMLHAAGYEVMVCGPQLRDELKGMKFDCVVGVEQAVSYGCDPLDPELNIRQATVDDLRRCDLWVDIKVNNLALAWNRWPRLKGRTAFWRVNGARPEHVRRPDGKGGIIDCGDEANPGCPTITANLWYGIELYDPDKKNYTFWPPYPRAHYFAPEERERHRGKQLPPFALIHGVNGWGFKEIVPKCVDMGVRIYGHNSPAGPITHSRVPYIVERSLAMVHIKGSDCPGWSLYEALLGGCPVICARWMVKRMIGEALFEDGVTCLLFGVECDETGRGDARFDLCVDDIHRHLETVKDPHENHRIGMAGRDRLLSLMWDVDRDGPGFKAYCERSFS